MGTVTERRVERNLGIDLLRILSMFMVVLLHILGTGGVLSNTVTLSLNYNVAYFIEIAAYCAVNCYALVSGYVGLNSRHRFSNIAALWLQVVFYCVVITTTMFFFYPQLINWKSFVKAFFPVTFSSYWYFTAYFCMWFFIPIMNTAIKKLNKKEMGQCLLCGGIIIIPISLLTDSFGLNKGYGVIWLAFLYLTGAYIAEYDLLKCFSAKKSLIVVVLSVFISWTAKLLFIKFLGKDNFFDSKIQNYVSPFVFLEAVALLSLFSKIKPVGKTAKLISVLSPLCFSVYLIHTHPLIFYNVFSDLFSKLAKASAPVMNIGVLASAVAVYIGCSAIDSVRLWLFKKLQIKKKLDSIEEKSEVIVKKLAEKFR